MKYKCIFFFLHLLSLQIIYTVAVSLVKVKPEQDQQQQQHQQEQQLVPLLGKSLILNINKENQNEISSLISSNKISARSMKIEPRQLEALSPKRFFDFITDPSLLITVLHSLEVAYWTFPFGFLLKPIINFFRVPNRRSLDYSSVQTIPTTGKLSLSSSPQPHQLAHRSVRSVNPKVNFYHLKLLSSLAKYDSMNNNHRII